ncbi:MAG: alpha/beta hydrolase [Planctomycetes bacterium]|nr:alpha/beta hydrolase [Planctomycetota bacterium]
MADRARRRRRWRWLGWTAALLLLTHGVLILLHVPIARPFDLLLNLGPVVEEPALRAPADGRRRVVVLVHGMFRTSASLWRLARTLRAHGYEVVAFDYWSNAAPIEAHAAALHDAVEDLWRSGPVDELSFVAHSMGGVVTEEYLRREDARVPVRCVYLGVPHRGAVLADLRKHWFLFRWAMGETAALQLSPGDPMVQQPIPTPCPVGTIVGDLGEGNRSIPGHDDGTVGVAEATFAGATDSVVVPLGHTSLTFGDQSLRLVLAFLRHGSFGGDGNR